MEFPVFWSVLCNISWLGGTNAWRYQLQVTLKSAGKESMYHILVVHWLWKVPEVSGQWSFFFFHSHLLILLLLQAPGHLWSSPVPNPSPPQFSQSDWSTVATESAKIQVNDGEIEQKYLHVHVKEFLKLKHVVSNEESRRRRNAKSVFLVQVAESIGAIS